MARARLILDNGGGATLQIGDWAHYYDGGRTAQVAEDIGTWLDTQSTDGWDGHEDEAAECDPTLEEIQNGGYRVVQIEGTREDVATALRRSWGEAIADILSPAAEAGAESA